jgi:hypothetical protein
MYITFPRIPFLAGCEPVAITAEFTRVWLGNAEWLLVKFTPSFRNWNRVGVS